MSDVEVQPELREIVGAVLFAAKQPVTAARLCEVFRGAADQFGGAAAAFAEVTEADIEAAVAAVREALAAGGLGLRVVSVAGGYRMENDTRCGLWLRQYLEKGRPTRLSGPALETLAIVAYRQPVTRAQIEAVRGVAVDAIVRTLLDLQLIRAVGRSDLPGRPWLFGTTQRFLEHFGLHSLDDLPGVEELRETRAASTAAAAAGAPASAPDAGASAPAGPDADEAPPPDTEGPPPDAEDPEPDTEDPAPDAETPVSETQGPAPDTESPPPPEADDRRIELADTADEPEAPATRGKPTDGGGPA